MELKYFLFHILVHLFLVVLIFFVFQLSSFNLLLVIIVSGLIDLDHISFIKKHGIDAWIKVWSSHSPKSYPLHNFVAIFIFSIASFLVLIPKLFSLGICFLAIAVHLLWDLFEDAIIFKMGIEHWKFKYKKLEVGD